MKKHSVVGMESYDIVSPTEPAFEEIKHTLVFRTKELNASIKVKLPSTFQPLELHRSETDEKEWQLVYSNLNAVPEVDTLLRITLEDEQEMPFDEEYEGNFYHWPYSIMSYTEHSDDGKTLLFAVDLWVAQHRFVPLQKD